MVHVTFVKSKSRSIYITTAKMTFCESHNNQDDITSGNKI